MCSTQQNIEPDQDKTSVNTGNYLEAVDFEILSESNSSKLISKRLLCELSKSEEDESERKIVFEISKKLDFLIEIILNKYDNKIHYIQNFMCYIVEINSEIIRLLPEFENLKSDINLRFIITAKNIYNYALEVYFSLHDLYNVRSLT
jgi:hypothetical protein